MALNYFNAWAAVQNTAAFMYIFIGGRGVGKTYSMLSNAVLSGISFMYVRRTETELKNCCKETLNPFQKINTDFNLNVKVKATGDSFSIINDDKVIGIAGAVSTFGKFRGADYSNIDLIIFDEFIPTGKSNIKGERDLLFNMIETVNRNRELSGDEPVKIVMLSNANTIDCDIIRVLNLAEQIRQMKINDIEIWQDHDRGIYLQLLKPGEISLLKAKTALYKLTAGTSFYDMAIGNEFTGDSFDDVKRIDPKKLTPLCSINNIYLYTIKDSDYLYITYRKADVADSYTDDTIKAFKRAYGPLLDYYITNDLIYFYNYNIKLDFINLF